MNTSFQVCESLCNMHVYLCVFDLESRCCCCYGFRIPVRPGTEADNSSITNSTDIQPQEPYPHTVKSKSSVLSLGPRGHTYLKSTWKSKIWTQIQFNLFALDGSNICAPILLCRTVFPFPSSVLTHKTCSKTHKSNCCSADVPACTQL